MSSWEERMAQRAAERRATNPEPEDPHSGPEHIRYHISNSAYCSCGEFFGIGSIALTGDIAERCHNQAQHAFFDYLTANGFQALNGALSAAVKAVLLVVGEEHPSFNPQEPTAHTKAWLAEEEAPQ